MDTALEGPGWERRLSWIAGPLVFVVLAATGLELVQVRSEVARDLLVFRTAGERWLAGEPLHRAADLGWGYKYAPGTAALFVPLALLPPRAAWAALCLASAAALAVFLQASARELDGRPRLVSQLLLLAMLNPFTTHLLGMGQLDALLLWAMAASEALAERRPFLSGLLWGVASSVKLPFLVFGVPALARRQGWRIAGLAACLAAVFLAGVARYGLGGHAAALAAWRELLATTTPPLLCDEQNQSAFSIACRYLAAPGTPHYQVAVGAVAAVLLVPAALAWIRAGAGPGGRPWIASATCFYLTALLSPLGWRTNLLAAAPLLALLCSNARGGPAPRRALSAAAIAGVLAAEQLLRRALGDQRYLERQLFGLVVLGAVAAALLVAAAWPRRAGQQVSERQRADCPW